MTDAGSLVTVLIPGKIWVSIGHTDMLLLFHVMGFEVASTQKANMCELSVSVYLLGTVCGLFTDQELIFIPSFV